MTLTTIAVIVIALLILAAGYQLGRTIQRSESEREQLTQRVQQLEASQKHRNPYRTNDGLEDGMAVAYDIIQQSAGTIDYIRARADQLNTILKTIRADPDEYDSERCNGKKSSAGRVP